MDSIYLGILHVSHTLFYLMRFVWNIMNLNLIYDEFYMFQAHTKFPYSNKNMFSNNIISSHKSESQQAIKGSLLRAKIYLCLLS